MSRSQHAVHSFSAGVLTPRLLTRGDSDKYSQAIQAGDNWIVSPHGGLMFREGMEYIGSPNADEPFRIFTFRRGGDQTDVLVEVSAGTIRFWYDDGSNQIVPFPGSGTNRYALDELDGVYFTNDDVLGVLVHGDYPPIYITIDPDGTVFSEELTANRIPTFNYNDRKSGGRLATAATWKIIIPQSWEDPGTLYTMTYDYLTPKDGNNTLITYSWVRASATNITNMQAALDNIIAQHGYACVATVSSTSVGNDVFDYDVDFAGADSGYVMDMIGFEADKPTVTQTAVDARNDEPAWSKGYVVEHNGNYYQCIVPHLSVAGAGGNEPGVGATWTTNWTNLGTTAPWWYACQHGGSNAWADATNYVPWDRGFPRTNVFHQQRLIVASTYDGPTVLWGSEINNYAQFTGGADANDAFAFELDTTDTPSIKWMHSQLQLVLGTSSGDWEISAQVALGPTDIQASKQNGARSYLTRPESVDTGIFYIEQGRTKVRATEYQRGKLGFSSTDVSTLAENLFHPGVKRMALMHIPQVVMAFVTNDGDLLMLSYAREQGVAAWTRLQTEGTIIDVCSYFSTATNQDSFVCGVLRNGHYFIEQMPYPHQLFTEDLTANQHVYMDSWERGTIVDTNLVPVSSRLEGAILTVTIDDAYIGEFTVSNSEIVLPENESGEYAVGYAYSAYAKTFEMMNTNPRGTSLGTARRWNKMYVKVLDSALPIINGQLPEDRSPSVPMGTPETVREGIQDLRISLLGYDDGAVEIEQNRPYPTHVLGLFGELGTHNSG